MCFIEEFLSTRRVVTFGETQVSPKVFVAGSIPKEHSFARNSGEVSDEYPSETDKEHDCHPVSRNRIGDPSLRGFTMEDEPFDYPADGTNPK